MFFTISHRLIIHQPRTGAPHLNYSNHYLIFHYLHYSFRRMNWLKQDLIHYYHRSNLNHYLMNYLLISSYFKNHHHQKDLRRF